MTRTKTLTVVTPESLEAPPRRATRVPSSLLLDAPRRLAFLGLLAVTVVFIFGITTEFTSASALGGHTHKWTLIASFAGITLVILAVCRLGLKRNESVFNLTLIYQIAGACCISLLINKAVWPEDIVGFPAWSPLTIWILVVPLIVPNLPLRVLVASLIVATLDPLGVLLYVLLGDVSPPSPAALLQRFLPNYVVILPALATARFMYRMGASLTHAQAVGSYRLLARIGRGGMGEVWVATHRMLARKAAVKLIQPEVFRMGEEVDAKTILKRFEREAQATAGLRSPHTISVYDYGVSDDGRFYYVMEYLEGLNLGVLVERFGPQPPERVVCLLRQVCHSLHEAHQSCLIHRDIKPSNIMGCRYGGDDDFVKVLDFGLVKLRDPALPVDVARLDAGTMPGTPAFMPPEALTNPTMIDHRGDIYALGCVGYWLLTGQHLFTGRTPTEILEKHAREPAWRPSERCPFEMPEALDQVLLQCVAKKPEERPPSARELSRLLQDTGVEPLWTRERAAQWWDENTDIEITWACAIEPEPRAGG